MKRKVPQTRGVTILFVQNHFRARLKHFSLALSFIQVSRWIKFSIQELISCSFLDFFSVICWNCNCTSSTVSVLLFWDDNTFTKAVLFPTVSIYFIIYRNCSISQAIGSRSIGKSSLIFCNLLNELFGLRRFHRPHQLSPDSIQRLWRIQVKLS